MLNNDLDLTTADNVIPFPDRVSVFNIALAMKRKNQFLK